MTTDTDGRWVIKGLPAGRYALSASKEGYVKLSYGQKRTFEVAKPILVSAGESLAKLDISLPKAGVITGRVVDEAGDGFAGIRVAAMRVRFVDGQRRLMSASVSDTTDDLGEYRLHSLPPGMYYVSATAKATPFERSDDQGGYGTAFAPGTPLASEAQRFALAAGQELHGVDVTMSSVRTATVSGHAFTSTGVPLTDAVVTLVSAGPFGDGGMRMSNPSSVRPDGSFTLSNVLPGEYRLETHSIKDLEALAQSGATSAMTLAEVASVPLSVTGEDIRGLSVALRPTATVTGRIVFEGGIPRDATPSKVSIRTVPLGPDGSAFGGSVQLKSDWTFEAHGLAGRRLFRATAPAGWMLKSVSVDRNDVTDIGIGLEPGQQIENVRIVLGKAYRSLAGTVQSTTTGRPVLDYVVIVFAAESSKWGPGTRFVKVARSDQFGMFQIDGLPSGDYLVAAVDTLELGQESDPELLELLKPSATAVSVADGEAKQLVLTIPG